MEVYEPPPEEATVQRLGCRCAQAAAEAGLPPSVDRRFPSRHDVEDSWGAQDPPEPVGAGREHPPDDDQTRGPAVMTSTPMVVPWP
jgi:hypothetical protein